MPHGLLCLSNHPNIIVFKLHLSQHHAEQRDRLRNLQRIWMQFENRMWTFFPRKVFESMVKEEEYLSVLYATSLTDNL